MLVQSGAHASKESHNAAVHLAWARLWFLGAMGRKYSVKEALRILTGSRCVTPRQGFLQPCTSQPASKKTTVLIFSVVLVIFLSGFLSHAGKVDRRGNPVWKTSCLLLSLTWHALCYFFSLRFRMCFPICPAICFTRGPAQSKGAAPRCDSQPSKNNFRIDTQQ